MEVRPKSDETINRHPRRSATSKCWDDAIRGTLQPENNQHAAKGQWHPTYHFTMPPTTMRTIERTMLKKGLQSRFEIHKREKPIVKA